MQPKGGVGTAAAASYDETVKTPAAFQRQLDQLCLVTLEALPDDARLEQIRDAFARGRAGGNAVATNGQSADVNRGAERFLRILAAADQELEPTDVAQLEAYVQQCLTPARRLDGEHNGV